jgi:hypothetical protein
MVYIRCMAAVVLFGDIWSLEVGDRRRLVYSLVAWAGLAGFLFRIHMKLERKSRAQFGSAKISKVDALGCTFLDSFTIPDQGTPTSM